MVRLYTENIQEPDGPREIIGIRVRVRVRVGVRRFIGEDRM